MNSLSNKERTSGRVSQPSTAVFSAPDLPTEAHPVACTRVLAEFTGGELSSDAGLLALRGVDEQIGLTERLAAQLRDDRDVRYTKHSMADLLRQRVFAIAAGYEDTRDAAALRGDAMLKMMTGRLPVSGSELGSQPTLCRFENAPARADLMRMAWALVDQFVASYAQAPEAIVLDFDDTDSQTYGNQQLALFNTHYGGYCYTPLHVYEGLSGRLVTTILKPTQLRGAALLSIVRRLMGALRQVWPETQIIVRGDSHFTRPEVMQWIDRREGMHYVTGLMTNAVLQRRAASARERAERLYARRRQADEADPKAVLFEVFRYRARSWDRARRVIVKAEVTSRGTNIRFVVTNLEAPSPRSLYQQIYCRRGQAENYIKDHKRYLRSDKMSCHRFAANQFRLLLHSAAYVLFDTLRRELLRGTRWAGATIETLRLNLIKLAARVRQLKTRIKVIFPRSCPVQDVLRLCLQRLALPPPG